MDSHTPISKQGRLVQKVQSWLLRLLGSTPNPLNRCAGLYPLAAASARARRAAAACLQVVSKCALAAFLDCVADFPVSTQYAAAIVLTSSEMVLFQLVAFMSLISCVFSCYIYLSSFPWHLIFAGHERVLSRIARFL